MEEYSNIIAKIRSARLAAGITQGQMAERLGVNRVTYINIEAKRRPLSINELETICDNLGLSLSDISSQNQENVKYKAEKFKQLYYYILKNYFNEFGVPKTKLAKLIYLIDFTFFYLYNVPMTGAKYYKKQFGPLAEDFLIMTDALFDKGMINIKILESAQLISLSVSNNDMHFGVFNDNEKEVIKMVCEYWKDKRTSEIVNFTHAQKPWEERADNEYIPYLSIKTESLNNIYAPTTKGIEDLIK